MHLIKTIVQEYLKDVMYEADVIMRSDRGQKLTVVTDNLRGVYGITVVTVKRASEPVSENVEKTYLKVKFFQMEPTLEEQIQRMSIDARKIDGVHSFIPYRVNKVVNRIYRS
tara:strand:- start:502 stop:837 length:336 start_codon:yes stop_codon:yes gene_type:complete